MDNNVLTLDDIEAILSNQVPHSNTGRNGKLPRNYVLTYDGERIAKRANAIQSGYYTTPSRMSATKRARWKGGKATSNPQFMPGIALAVKATIV